MNNYAYITLFSTDNYLYGLIGLMYSGKDTNPKYPFYVVCTENISEVNKSILRKIGYNIIEEHTGLPDNYLKHLEMLKEKPQHGSGDHRVSLADNGGQHCGTKLLLFKYTQFDKLLFIDGDAGVGDNLDYLFDKPNFSSVAEIGSLYQKCLHFTSGFFVFEPSIEVANKLLDMANKSGIVDKGGTGCVQTEMDILNAYFSDWKFFPELHLPFATFLNGYVFDTGYYRNIDYVIHNLKNIKAIHLIGPKPGLEGTHYARKIDQEHNGLYRELYLGYIRFLNEALIDMYHKEIAQLQLIY